MPRPKSGTDPLQTTGIRLPAVMLAWLRERADAEGRSLSELVRELIAREMRADQARETR